MEEAITYEYNFYKCFDIKKRQNQNVIHFGVYQDFFCVHIDI